MKIRYVTISAILTGNTNYEIVKIDKREDRITQDSEKVYSLPGRSHLRLSPRIVCRKYDEFLWFWIRSLYTAHTH